MIATITFALLAATPGATARPAAPPEKLRCKRQAETGSLVRVHKECHTPAEWDAMGRDQRRDADDFIKPGYMPPPIGGG